ncbi:peptide deformylase [Pareuzebyella sediminis]|uniref:peptide deformylase n=1 Tax=Pareuzebyella sediminis TaxID=2607998 RepID=UPI0011EDE706|nr:peptide deformylase [Pareuzebyella sediminis]
MAVLEVIKLGHPLLRNKSDTVSKERLHSKEFQCFIDDLIATMRHEEGAGIAAPQVAILDRVFAMEMKENPRYPNKANFPLYVVVNPEIIKRSPEKTESWEGCLSIPGLRGRLERHRSITLKGLDRTGTTFEIELDGFSAIVAQHELDHLNGILFIDRMESMETLAFREEFEKYWTI